MIRAAFDLIERTLIRVGIDDAMRPVILGKMWSLVAGPVTMYLVARSLSPEEQGFNYTFTSLIALQVFLELGFSQSIIQFTAHEGAKVTFGSSRMLEGDPEGLHRLGALFRFFVRWYGVLAITFLLLVGSGGVWFFGREDHHGIRWFAPWCLIVGGTALSIALQPFWHFLTGLNQVALTNRISATNAVALNLILWAVLLLGGRLFGNAAYALASATLIASRLVLPHWRLWRQLWTLRSSSGSSIDFRRDILPFQWRITFTFLTGYFVFELFTPACFRFAGPVEAGRFGMTLTLLLMVMNVAQAFVSNKYPLLSMLFARGDYTALQVTFRQAYLRSMGLATLGLAVSIPALSLLQRVPLFADRLMPPALISVMALATLLQSAGLGLVYFVRAHRKEPFIAVAWVQAVVTALAVFFLGRTAGVSGIVIAHLITWVIGAPWIFLIFRSFWTAQPAPSPHGTAPDRRNPHL